MKQLKNLMRGVSALLTEVVKPTFDEAKVEGIAESLSERDLNFGNAIMVRIHQQKAKSLAKFGRWDDFSKILRAALQQFPGQDILDINEQVVDSASLIT